MSDSVLPPQDKDADYDDGQASLPGCPDFGAVDRYVDRSVPTRDGALDSARVKQARDYVEAHYASVIRVTDLARLAGLSTAHFSRAFKAATGLSPHKFITRRRLLAAREMIECSEQAVDEIVLRVGFTNLSHCRRLFRSQFGAPPQAFRGQRLKLHRPARRRPRM